MTNSHFIVAVAASHQPSSEVSSDHYSGRSISKEGRSPIKELDSFVTITNMVHPSSCMDADSQCCNQAGHHSSFRLSARNLRVNRSDL
jgi:hypothetical protein